MKKLKTTILSLCLILIGVSVIFCVSAVDNNTIVFNETDNTTDSINTTNDGVVVSNATTFQELQQDINKYDNIELAHDITRHGGKKIEINKKVTIDGKGHTIDGEKSKKDRIIYINSNGDLTLKNSNVNNGRYYSAIWNSGKLTIDKSTFNNNKVDDFDGGAIYNKGTLTITDSVFNGNTADFDGGAIYSPSGKINLIQGCTFKDNVADSHAWTRCEGGAIKCTGSNLICVDCIFIGNRAESGGAIDCRVLELENCVFTNNKASNSINNCIGGAVNCNDLNKCIGCNFTGNRADDGGAIAIMQKAGKNVIQDCIFKDNKGLGGGAISIDKNKAHLSLIHNQFIDNTAKHGNNVYNNGYYDKIEYNYFLNEKQNTFQTGNHKDQHPYYNLDDYYNHKI